jgi:hypothetical protein
MTKHKPSTEGRLRIYHQCSAHRLDFQTLPDAQRAVMLNLVGGVDLDRDSCMELVSWWLERAREATDPEVAWALRTCALELAGIYELADRWPELRTHRAALAELTR